MDRKASEQSSTLLDVLHSRIFAVLEPLVDTERDAVIIEPPSHPNVGDSAIYMGEVEYFRRVLPGRHVPIIDHINMSDRILHAITPSSIVFFHGGGNFGDLWWRHHQVRLKVLERFPGVPAVQFPQSIHFQSEQELEKTKRIIGGHSNFTLIVRDEVSETFAHANFDCPVILAPDMAFAMPAMRRTKPTCDIYCLLRMDREQRIDFHADIPSRLGEQYNTVIGDWAPQKLTFRKMMMKGIGVLEKAVPLGSGLMSQFNSILRRSYCDSRVEIGAALLSRGRLVVTDRLHAHIFCVLMGMPHIVFDSLDGKVAAFHKTWTSQVENCTFCGSLDEAAAAAPNLLKSAA